MAGSTDEALMARLGEVIQGMKEDFMVVHFREPCSFCRKYLSDEPRCRGSLATSLTCFALGPWPFQLLGGVMRHAAAGLQWCT